MSFRKVIFIIGFVFSAFSLSAHEGHDTGVAKSLYGGIVKKSKNVFVETVQDEKIEIYITDHDYKNLITPSLKVSAFAEIKGKKIPLKLESHNKKITVATDLKREKHFKLNVVVKINGKDEKVVFPLEN